MHVFFDYIIIQHTYYTVNVPSGLRPCVRYILSITHFIWVVNSSLGLFYSNSLELSFLFCTRFFCFITYIS